LSVSDRDAREYLIAAAHDLRRPGSRRLPWLRCGRWHDEAVLVVVSGLPGVGKSSMADALGRKLGAAVLSVDPIEAAIWRCGIRPSFETGVAAYEVAAVLAEHQLGLGLTVIVDSVSSLEVARDRWRQAAQRSGNTMRVVEVICSDEASHRQRLGARARGIDGFPEPSWDDVLRRRDEWQPWVDDRLVVDSMRGLDENVADAVAFLTG
jgi:predicted kinase